MRNRVQSIKKYKVGKGFRVYKPIRYPNIPFSVDDIYVTTTAGDRLDLLANQFYNDVRLWWVISIANRDLIRRDTYNLKPGMEIRIPGQVRNILKEYEMLNKE